MQSTIREWNPLVRLFHRSLVLAFPAAFASGDEWLDLHVPAGDLLGGLIAFRLVWGIVGPRHARFSDFVRLPAAVRAYLGDLAALRAPRHSHCAR
jgi:cytochrome b